MKWHFWHTALLVFFAALCVVAYAWLDALGALGKSVPFADFLLMALAAMRLTRLFSYDSITAFVRDWFADAEPRSLKGSLGTLIHCPWCTALWFALLILFFYFALPVITWYALVLLSLSAIASVLQIFANWLGWSAEAKKREAQAPILPR
jgi:hypothetical protein